MIGKSINQKLAPVHAKLNKAFPFDPNILVKSKRPLGPLLTIVSIFVLTPRTVNGVCIPIMRNNEPITAIVMTVMVMIFLLVKIFLIFSQFTQNYVPSFKIELRCKKQHNNSWR